MRRLGTLLLAAPLMWAAPGLTAAQDVDRQTDERRRDDFRAEPAWSGADDVRQAASQIAARATELARTMRDVEGYSPLTDEARQFARTARIFERSIRSNAPYEQVLSSFDVLQREYHQMRESFFRAHRAHHVEDVVGAWTSLVSNYERLALALGVDDDRLCVLPEDPDRFEHDDRFGRGDGFGRSDPYREPDRFDRYDDRFDQDRYGRYDPRFDRR